MYTALHVFTNEIRFIQCSDYRGPVTSITEYIKKPTFPTLVQCFLYHQLSSNSGLDVNASSSSEASSAQRLPIFDKKLFLHNSTLSVFFAPSDPCSIHGLHQEQIQLVWSWREGSLQQDMVLVNTGEGGNKDLPISGYTIACILLLFSFEYASENFPMALVWWYILSNNARCRDEATGMWLVEC